MEIDIEDLCMELKQYRLLLNLGIVDMLEYCHDTVSRCTSVSPNSLGLGGCL